MSDPVGIVFAFAGALSLSLPLCYLVMQVAPRDMPTDGRAQVMHTAPTPTSGGLGFGFAALMAAGLVTWIGRMTPDPGAAALATAGLVLMLLGFADDRFNLPARAKLVAMVVIGVALGAAGVMVQHLNPSPNREWILPLWAGVAGSTLWIVTIVNAVNFMDGANGVAMGMGAIAALALAICAFMVGAPEGGLLALTASGALAGFLWWNVKGRLFAGDAGSLFVGVILAGVSLMIIKARPDLLFVPPTILMPFLSDVLLTLVWRTLKGKKLFDAHRDHSYQIALKAGLKHWQVALIHAVLAMNAALLGIMAAIAGGWAPLAVFVALTVASAWVHLRVRRSGEKRGLVGVDVR